VSLNSDVVPIDGRWMSRLRAAATRQRHIGVVGPKLLFEDDSLQHAGLYYGRELTGRWLNRHFYKGYPRDYAPANVPRAVPGVTGGCMLMERALFERLGGLSEDYIIADYEDSDLCLRLFEAGRACWYEPAVELYHLERQSVAKHEGYMRSVVSEYNRSLHQSRWEGLMEEVMRRHGSGDAVPAPADLPLPAAAGD
jgi:GT2 family glycosyltransferase